MRRCILFIVQFCAIMASAYGQPGPMLISDSGRKSASIYDESLNAIWTTPAGKTYDLLLLGNGHMLVTTGNGVREVTPEGKVVFEFAVNGEVMACEELPDGAILIGNLNGPSVLMIQPHRDGANAGSAAVIGEIKLAGKPGHLNHRAVRLTTDRTILVGHLGENVAREYDMSGKIVNTFKAPGPVYMAQRLKDGNTLVSYKTGVIEFDPKTNTVWHIKAEDVAEVEPYWFTCALRLPNGNTLIGNWLGHGHNGKGVPLFEVNPDKKVVWQAPRNGPLSEVTNVRLLSDVPRSYADTQRKEANQRPVIRPNSKQETKQ